MRDIVKTSALLLLYIFLIGLLCGPAIVDSAVHGILTVFKP